MLPQEIIRRKRDGETLADDEIEFLITGLTLGDVTASQAAAFAMARSRSGSCTPASRASTMPIVRLSPG